MYKIGDKIRINSDLTASTTRYRFDVPPSMQKYRGEIATIQKACALGDGKTYYRIDIDSCRYGWTPDMFTLVEDDIDLQALLDLI